MKLEPSAGVNVSAAARRSILVVGGGVVRRGRWSSQISHSLLLSKVFQQRTSVIKACMLNSYFLRLSGLKFEKNDKNMPPVTQ